MNAEEILTEYGQIGINSTNVKVKSGGSPCTEDLDNINMDPLNMLSSSTSSVGVNVFDTKAVLEYIRKCSNSCSFAAVLDIVSTQATCLMALLDKEQPWFQTLEECRECSSDSNSYGRAMWSKRSQAVMYFLLDGLHFMMHVVAPYMPVLAGAMHRVYLVEGFIAKAGNQPTFPSL